MTFLQPEKYFTPAAIIFISILLGLIAVQGFSAGFGSPFVPGVRISQNMLADKYGLKVSLIAVSAAGGKIDFRLRMLDAQKARLLLQDAQNFPVLVAANGKILSLDADSKPDSIDFIQNRNLLYLYANSSGVITPGAPVIIRFGNIELDPVVSK